MQKNSRGTKDQLLIDKAILKNCWRRLTNLSHDMDRLLGSIWHGAPFMDFGMCKNGWSGGEYNHLDIEQHGKLEDSVNIKSGRTWKSNLKRRLIIAITVCDHHDATVTDSKGHKSWLPTQERRMQDQSPAIKDDLKLYGKNSSPIDSLVQTVWSYSEDIGMKFGIDKCAVLELERGRLVKSEGIELADVERMKEVDQEGYKLHWGTSAR